MDSEQSWHEWADDTQPDETTDPAPARLKSRIYSGLLREQAATGPLRGVSSTRAAGRRLCVFEEAIAAMPLPERVTSLNFCRVCHARYLAEHLERAPIFWPHCPYSGFHRR